MRSDPLPPATAGAMVRAARRGDEVDGSKLERGPILLDKPDDGDEKTIDSIAKSV